MLFAEERSSKRMSQKTYNVEMNILSRLDRIHPWKKNWGVRGGMVIMVYHAARSRNQLLYRKEEINH